MNRNVLIAFGGATLIALVVALMLNAVLRGKPEDKAASAPQIEILVATKDLKPGQLLADDAVKWQVWPQAAVFPGIVQRKDKTEKPLDALSGRLVTSVATGEPLMRNALVKDDGGFMAAMLEPGFRAVAVKVSAETTAGGFVNPGDHVDVILTYKLKVDVNTEDNNLKNELQNVINKNLDRYATETILQNVKVLGTDQKAVKDEESTAKVAKTVTLAVSEHDAEVLALSQQMGDVSLALRGLGDNKILTDRGPVVSDARVTNIGKEIHDEMDRVTGTSGSVPSNVRIYNGNAVTTVPAR